jgi:hypothetical protein
MPANLAQQVGNNRSMLNDPPSVPSLPAAGRRFRQSARVPAVPQRWPE